MTVSAAQRSTFFLVRRWVYARWFICSNTISGCMHTRTFYCRSGTREREQVICRTCFGSGPRPHNSTHVIVGRNRQSEWFRIFMTIQSVWQRFQHFVVMQKFYYPNGHRRRGMRAKMQKQIRFESKSTACSSTYFLSYPIHAVLFLCTRIHLCIIMNSTIIFASMQWWIVQSPCCRCAKNPNRAFTWHSTNEFIRTRSSGLGCCWGLAPLAQSSHEQNEPN